MVEEYRPIIFTPGVQPVTDFTTSSTQHWVAADKIRFVDGRPAKIGGWLNFPFQSDNTIDGCARAIFSYVLEKRNRFIIGTHTRLYDLTGSDLTNITPLVTATTAIPDSLDSNYTTLANDPLSTVSGTNVITVSDPGTKLKPSDRVEILGATGFNGIPAGELNTQHLVREAGPDDYTFFVSSNATSTGSGGGAAVDQATAIITVNQVAHGNLDGDRVKITLAASFAGIPDTEINAEHIIRDVTTDAFDIVVNTFATSSVTGGGGAATEIQEQIAPGDCDASIGQGYGAGLYGVGLYGVPKTSDNIAVFPRRWTFDRFGNNIILSPGEQTGVYTWDSDESEAPILLSGAPTAVNLVFVSNEIVVTLGASNVGNRIQWSDQGDSTDWTPLATNQAGQDDIEGAGTFLAVIKLRNVNLLLTETQVYTFRYIRRPLIWEIKLLDERSGIIAQNARISHNGIAYWMGDDNFYMYRGGNVEIIPSNSTPETTLKKFVFENLNTAQKSKIFAWFNRKFHEIWWHYPSAGSLECDRVVRFNVKDFTWTPDTMERTAGEYPVPLTVNPFVATLNDDRTESILYQHEKGNNDNLDSLPFSLTSPFVNSGTRTVNGLGFAPDSIQTGDISVQIAFKKYPQDTRLFNNGPYTVTPTKNHIDYTSQGRFWRYLITGDELNQEWIAGFWQEFLRGSSRR